MALCVHLAMFAFVLASGSGRALSTGVGAGAGEEKGIVVSLVGRKGDPVSAGSTSGGSNQQDPMAHLFRRLQADSPVYIPQQSSSAKAQSNISDLFDAIDRGRADRRQSAARDSGQNGSADGASSSKGQAAQGKSTDSRSQSGGSALSSGKLWSQIARCWRPQGATVPVTLEVVLDGRGRIAIPPRILRPTTTPPNGQRLVAETRAIQAVASCAPFDLPGFGPGRQTYRFDFVPPR